MTLNCIFIPHLIDSTSAVIIFAFLIRRYYKTLPNSPEHKLPPSLAKRLMTTRLFNYLLRVSKNMFTQNLLTPLFAVKFGLTSAGLFYFASIVISSIQSVVKAVIGYSGNSLLANIKQSPQSVKKEAFNVLSQKLIKLVAPILLFLIINHRGIIKLSYRHDATSYTISLSLLYLIISFTEFFFILYEQFYIIEEAANKLFFFKLFEFAIFYGLITSSIVSNPIITLVGLIVLRLISFFIIAFNAYYLWKIKPNLTTNISYLIICIIISVLVSFLW